MKFQPGDIVLARLPCSKKTQVALVYATRCDVLRRDRVIVAYGRVANSGAALARQYGEFHCAEPDELERAGLSQETCFDFKAQTSLPSSCICFSGGRIDLDDDRVMARLRQAAEEVDRFSAT